jgi:hypothetical protein
MSLRKQWRELDRSLVSQVPDRYAFYELGDIDGNTIGFGIGALPDELREILAYGEGTEFHYITDAADVGDPAQIRWELANNKPHAEHLLAERLDN